MSTTSSPQKPSSSRSRRDKDDTTNPDLGLTQIGNYVLQKTVGEGNFAKVKLAKHKLTGVEVAIKIIDKTTLDEKKLGKLYREVRIMKMLHHPNIVKLYEVIETKSTVFLIMEYASGGELYDYLVVHGKMKEKEARVKFRQILSAVSYCHKKRVIHRDLKAENLLLDSNLDIKIADFGFSNMFDPDSKLDTFCGSPPYAAPELFQGRRYTGPEVDIWSLGVILYVLTTGCLPFDGKNLQEMRESVCRGKYRIPFYLSDSCEKLLRKFLIRDPLKRASLDMLIDDPWINESFDSSPIVVDTSSKIEEDDALVRIMEAKFHIDRDTIMRSLRENVYDDIAAIYYLLYHEKDMRNLIAAEVAVPLTVGKKEAHKEDPAMGRIEEDAVAQEGSDTIGAAPQRRNLKDKPKKRRFTVGGEADVAKLADEDEEAAEMLKKLQNPVAATKDDTAKPSVGAVLTQRAENTTVSTAIPTPPTYPAPAPPATAPAVGSQSAVTAGIPANATSMGSTDATDEVRTQRKRHNTIVGILRSTIRRPSETSPTGLSPISPSSDKGGDMVGGSSSAATTVANSTESNTSVSVASGAATGGSDTASVAGEENKPRSLRFTFNSNTTSSRPPDEIMNEVISACDRFGISHRLTSRFLLECSCPSVPTPGVPPVPGNDVVRIEIEICKLPRLKNLHGLRFKRVGGSSAEYKDVCEKILGGLSL